jgi:hypothetical protein
MAYKGQRVPMDDDRERTMGAMQFIQQRFSGVKPKEVQEYKSQGQFVSAMKDVLSESEVSSMYPSEVWEPQANRFLKNLWAKHSKKMATAKKPVPGSSRGSRIQMR